MSKFKVLIADSRYKGYDQEEAVLSEIGAQVIYERSDDEAKLAALVPDVDGLIVNLAPVTARVISAMNRCKCISRYGVGYDNVDVKAAAARNITVTVVRDYCMDDVAEQALALLMACVRKIVVCDRGVRAGRWNIPERMPIYRMTGKTLGLVGFGNIARALAKKMSGFGLAEVLSSDPVVSADEMKKAGVRKVELDELLGTSDFISVHAPLIPATRNMIGVRQLAQMKKSAILVNTSRGGLVDAVALHAALAAGTIASAGIDVFEPEPPPKDSKLFALPNIVLSDHVGWYSEESQVDLKTKAARNVALVLTGRKPLFQVSA